ncbi:hypothetical protein MW887_007993 [Aspergillus wentii]|nr:hypothetical protein MW887_007993 [Aspergillus wentii]
MSQPETTDSIPPLTTYPATSESEQIAALRLIADSIAQQRQTASYAIISHPLTLSLTAIPLAVIYKYLYNDRSDWPIIGTTWAGCLMAGLLLVRLMTNAYIELAEKTGTWRWLRSTQKQDADADQDTEDDVVLVTKYGQEIIGALVLRAPDCISSANADADADADADFASRVASIRAWTVKLRYRRKGIGRGLLEAAVGVCRERGWDGVEFAVGHAHSGRLGYGGVFDGVFEERERWGRGVLECIQRG